MCVQGFRGRGEIGRRRRLKIFRRKACGFESRRPYQRNNAQDQARNCDFDLRFLVCIRFALHRILTAPSTFRGHCRKWNYPRRRPRCGGPSIVPLGRNAILSHALTPPKAEVWQRAGAGLVARLMPSRSRPAYLCVCDISWQTQGVRDCHALQSTPVDMSSQDTPTMQRYEMPGGWVWS